MKQFAFTWMHLENFQSFTGIDFDLTAARGGYKNLAMVYGENGIGKSGLMMGFTALEDVMLTMDYKNRLECLLRYQENTASRMDFGKLDSVAIGNAYRTAGSTEPVVLEYEFLIKGKKGRYRIEIGQEEILHERLEYVVEKNRGVHFDLTPEKQKINPKIFRDTEAYASIQKSVQQYWGKHSLLAILMHEKDDKSARYISNSLAEPLKDVLVYFASISYLTDVEGRLGGDRVVGKNLLLAPPDIGSGSIGLEEAGRLEKMERVMNLLFCAISSDNRRVFYERKPEGENQIAYQLYIIKLIAGKERKVSFEQESTGNRRLLSILPFLLTAMTGGVAIVDEMERGIHDMLFEKIMQEAIPHITGQLIMTTHNTMLMTIKNIKNSIYILKEDEQANKEVVCLDSIDKRLYQQNNIRQQYIGGYIGGIPQMDDVGGGSVLKKCTAVAGEV